VDPFTESNDSEQNICRNRRLKIHFQRCCASQNKTQPRTQSITFAYLLLRKYPALVPAGHVAPKILNYQGREGQISNFNVSTFQK
jgi:hypothetical protein